ncbi:hypothetical protein PQS31_00055 [Luteimonas sp BLCC-B24]|uniref:hypothetical protein n=1 Tax=Luteimonas sp. BLCC-B24 TaxID=3025317 RepID=UPI00234D347A|nr:hypothetical protein [Luteimonas sp. BLCC-B24]MDC7805223.1 hypothetical protein [Luteimonas sp. BLCC-B24]
MATVLVAACLERDFDAATGTCQQVIWIPQPSLIPELSVADAQQIGVSVAYVLAIAFVFRLLRKFLENS